MIFNMLITERERLVAWSHQFRTQYLRIREQAGSKNQLPMVRNKQYQLR